MAVNYQSMGPLDATSAARPLDLRMGAALLEVSRQPVVLVDREGRIRAANQAFRDTVGLADRALLGRKLQALVEGEAAAFAACARDFEGPSGAHRVRISGGDGRKLELIMRCGRAGADDSALRFAWFSPWDGGGDSGQQAVAADSRAASALLAFRDHLQESVTAAARARMSLLVFLVEIVDVQGLGARLGRQGSQEILRAAVRRMKNTIEGVGTVARLPGGRFAVLAPVRGAAPMARRVANVIAYSLRRPYTLGTRQIDVRVITGQAVSPSDGQDHDSLLRTAEVELLAAREFIAER